jgi:imidazole glycerol phosphate synthase subunit HisF
MIRKRIIAPVLTDGNRVYNSYIFESLKSVGDLDILLNKLETYKIDEIIILDISKKMGSSFNAKIFFKILDNCNLKTPITFGGNLECIDDASQFIYSGIERLILGPKSLINTNLISSISDLFGFSSLVLNIPVHNYDLLTKKFTISVQGRETSMNIEELRIPKNFSGEICIMDVLAQGTNKPHNLEYVNILSGIFIDTKFILYGGFGFKLSEKDLKADYISGIAIDNGLTFTELPRKNYVSDLPYFRKV